ncbi:glutamine amidotransferase [Maribacter polysaccharolyticus]|uniref:glutamine amidotransferase n=1 Tax=Maribacter polysaccharolyticus TaxID=3020831 RepID=UPI00237F9FB2|nr:glutamine amidotransferase [Maribacter polysaccharolyticus]MDE3740201.1 glutamine amidotransferase [Maribacter polysaccharolyticus]
MILILKTGTTFTSIKSRYGDFEDWIIGKMNLKAGEYIIHPTEDYQNIPPNYSYKGIVITGSHAMVTDIEPHESKMCKWLLNAHKKEVPILGICYGHQLLSALMGGMVTYNARGTVIGSENTCLTQAGLEDKLLGGFSPIFKVYKAHKQSASKLPKSAEILAKNESGMIDAFRWNKNTWGIQFHPEFDQNITKAYINELSLELVNEGQDALKLANAVVEMDYGTRILQCFKRIADNTSRIIERNQSSNNG